MRVRWINAAARRSIVVPGEPAVPVTSSSFFATIKRAARGGAFFHSAPPHNRAVTQSMPLPPLTSQIPPSRLDLDDKRYMLAPLEESPPRSLISSIQEFGVMHPPLVGETRPERFTIVSGRKRVLASLQAHPEKHIPCLVVPPGSDETRIFALLLTHASLDAPLSIVEQANLAKKLLQNRNEKDVMPFLAMLGLKQNSHALNELLEISKSPLPILQALHDGTIKPVNARKIRRLSESDQLFLLEIIRQLNLSGSKQQRFISMSFELAMRRGSPLRDIMRNAPVPAGEGRANIPQQAAAMLKWLDNECSPRLNEAKKQFRKHLARLNLPPNMQVSHSPSFEDDRLALTVQCSDWDDLKQVVRKLDGK